MSSHERPNEGNTNVWLTPRWLIESLGEFDTDPCACTNPPWPTARNMYFESDDGLRMDWSGRVWLNPPYGPHTGKWLSRLSCHGNGIALIFARTETSAFRNYVWGSASCSGVMFLSKRLVFCDSNGLAGKGNAGAPSCLVAYGKENLDSIIASGLTGAVVRLIANMV